MSNSYKYIIIILSIIIFSVLSCQKSTKKESFREVYSLNNIDRAEASLFKKNDFKEIDYERLLDVLQNSKLVLAKFIPHREVTLYRQDTTIYTLYFSDKYGAFQIEGKTFTLTEDESKLVFNILE